MSLLKIHFQEEFKARVNFIMAFVSVFSKFWYLIHLTLHLLLNEFVFHSSQNIYFLNTHWRNVYGLFVGTLVYSETLSFAAKSVKIITFNWIKYNFNGAQSDVGHETGRERERERTTWNEHLTPFNFHYHNIIFIIFKCKWVYGWMYKLINVCVSNKLSLVLSMVFGQ